MAGRTEQMYKVTEETTHNRPRAGPWFPASVILPHFYIISANYRGLSYNFAPPPKHPWPPTILWWSLFSLLHKVLSQSQASPWLNDTGKWWIPHSQVTLSDSVSEVMHMPSLWLEDIGSLIVGDQSHRPQVSQRNSISWLRLRREEYHGKTCMFLEGNMTKTESIPKCCTGHLFLWISPLRWRYTG